jgi:hypothetical protein
MKHDFKYLDYEIKFGYIGKGKFTIDARNYKKNDFLSFIVKPIMRREFIENDLIYSIKNYIKKHEQRGY